MSRKTSTIWMVLLLVLAITGIVQAMPPADGVYKLNNHPDGDAAPPLYGLRLDKLIPVEGIDHPIFTFDFEDERSNITMTVLGSTIHIQGVAFGGLDVGDHYAGTGDDDDDDDDCDDDDDDKKKKKDDDEDDDDFDESFDAANLVGVWAIDFEYDNVESLGDDDDLVVRGENAGTNRGTMRKTFGDGATFVLTDYAGDHEFSFRLGDEDDDQGHRGTGPDVLSGWGWLNHSVDGNHDDDDDGGRLGIGDWLFTAEFLEGPDPTVIPEPSVGALGLIALAGWGIRSRRGRRY